MWQNAERAAKLRDRNLEISRLFSASFYVVFDLIFELKAPFSPSKQCFHGIFRVVPHKVSTFDLFRFDYYINVNLFFAEISREILPFF